MKPSAALASARVTEGQLQDLARQLQELSGMEDATAEDVARALGLDPDGPVPPFASPDTPAAAEPSPPADSHPEWPPPPDTEAPDTEARDGDVSDPETSDYGRKASDEPPADQPADADDPKPSSTP
jgi:hypothetical protein